MPPATQHVLLLLLLLLLAVACQVARAQDTSKQADVQQPWWRNPVAFLVTAGLCDVWLRLTRAVAARQWLSRSLCRKLVHVMTGVIYLMCWPLFGNDAAAPWWAASIITLIVLKFVAIGLGYLHDPHSVNSMSRSGDPRELLGGPLAYGCVFVLVTLLAWRTRVAVAVLMTLCAGDGLAAVFGVLPPFTHLAWNRDKTLAGTTGYFVCAYSAVVWIARFAASQGWFAFGSVADENWAGLLCLVSALLESIPMRDHDNEVVALLVYLGDRAGVFDVLRDTTLAYSALHVLHAAGALFLAFHVLRWRRQHVQHSV